MNPMQHYLVVANMNEGVNQKQNLFIINVSREINNRKIMKTKLLCITVILYILGTSFGFAQNSKTVNFKVSGNCGLCKNRIEKTAQSVEGVSLAYWDKETKLISVTLDTTITDVLKVNIAIAKAGHDTEMRYALYDAYNALPGCCEFERRIDQKNIIFK